MFCAPLTFLQYFHNKQYTPPSRTISLGGINSFIPRSQSIVKRYWYTKHVFTFSVTLHIQLCWERGPLCLLSQPLKEPWKPESPLYSTYDLTGRTMFLRLSILLYFIAIFTILLLYYSHKYCCLSLYVIFVYLGIWSKCEQKTLWTFALYILFSGKHWLLSYLATAYVNEIISKLPTRKLYVIFQNWESMKSHFWIKQCIEVYI